MTVDIDRDTAWQLTDAIEVFLAEYPEAEKLRELMDNLLERLTA